jgi:hypothetical protein
VPDDAEVRGARFGQEGAVVLRLVLRVPSCSTPVAAVRPGGARRAAVHRGAPGVRALVQGHAVELESVRDRSRRQRQGARRSPGRVHAVEQVMIEHIGVIETTTPRTSSFRSHCPGSGFQSVQFREIESVSGPREPGLLSSADGRRVTGWTGGGPSPRSGTRSVRCSRRGASPCRRTTRQRAARA